MNKRDVAGFRARWGTVEGRVLAVAAARWLAVGGAVPEGVGTVDGRVDLRGLLFPAAHYVGSTIVAGRRFDTIGGMPEFHNPQWVGVDLSGARLEDGRLFGATIRDCRFDFADLSRLRMWGSTVTDCSFVGATIVDGALGTGVSADWGRDEWVGVNFDRANLTDVQFTRALLQGCTFSGSKLRLATFKRVEFVDVVIEAVLERVRFDGLFNADEDYAPPPMRRVDLSGCTPKDVYFEGYRLEDVRLPPRALHIRNFPKVAARVAPMLVDEHEPFFGQLSERDALLLKRDPRSCWDSVQFFDDYARIGDAEIAIKIFALYERAMLELGDELECSPEQSPGSGSLGSKIRGLVRRK